MEERRIDRQRYWLAYFFDDMAVGTEFKPGVQHITIVPWFVTDTDEADLLKAFERKFAGTKSFDMKVEGLAKFGPKKDVEVNLLEPKKQIMDLHKQALSLMDEAKARWAVKNPHCGSEFKPHIRYREGPELASGQALRVYSLSLVKARRREDGLRTVAAKVKFDE